MIYKLRGWSFKSNVSIEVVLENKKIKIFCHFEIQMDYSLLIKIIGFFIIMKEKNCQMFSADYGVKLKENWQARKVSSELQAELVPIKWPESDWGPG